MSDFTDELECEDYNPVEDWEKGFHRTREGETIKISDIDYNHLKNTIKYFKDNYDTSLLEEELKSR